MKPKKLIPLSDYVLDMEDYYFSDYEGIREGFKDIINYTKFLKQPLELWMFVPCDRKGNILEPVIQMDYIPQVEGYPTKYPQECYEGGLKAYYRSLNRVIFKGFSFETKNNIEYLKYKKENMCFTLETFLATHKDIEDLTHLNLELK